MCLFPGWLITLDGAPFCFPSQDPLAVHLVLLVAAHDSERDHFLWSRQRMQSATGRRCVCVDGVLLRDGSREANSWRLPAHPDFVIDRSVLCILVELFLRVNVDPVGSQLFSNLHAQAQ